MSVADEHPSTGEFVEQMSELLPKSNLCPQISQKASTGISTVPAEYSIRPLQSVLIRPSSALAHGHAETPAQWQREHLSRAISPHQKTELPVSCQISNTISTKLPLHAVCFPATPHRLPAHTRKAHDLRLWDGLDAIEWFCEALQPHGLKYGNQIRIDHVESYVEPLPVFCNMLSNIYTIYIELRLRDPGRKELDD